MSTDAKGTEDPKSIVFRFETAGDYRIAAVNAVWGGITPRGDLQLDFCVDATTVPEVVENLIADGGLGAEVKRFPPDRTITRTRQVGILISVENAEGFAKFLTERIALMRQAIKDVRETKKAETGDAH